MTASQNADAAGTAGGAPTEYRISAHARPGCGAAVLVDGTLPDGTAVKSGLQLPLGHRANDVTTVKGERRRRAGIHANAAMWTDPVIKNTCMFDPIGGSVSFYDSHVRLEPA